MKIAFLALACLTINAMAQSDRPIVETTIYNSNGIDKPLSLQQFQYDLNGQQVGVSQYKWDTNQQGWSLQWMQEKKFDQGNEVISRAWFWKRYPDSIQYHWIRTQTFNNQQQLTYSSWFSQETYNNGEVHSYENKDTYYYDVNGCKVKVETERLDDNKISGKSDATYKVNANCQILESFAAQQLNRYEYDNGLLSREVSYIIRGDTTLYFEKIFRYNEKGQVILTEENGSFRTYIEYAKDGKANHYRSEYLPDNDTTWTPVVESFYSYNGNFLEKSENYLNWNPTDKFWQYVSRSINYFDNLGRIDSSAFTQHIVSKDGSTLISNEHHQNIRRCDGLETERIINRTSAYEAPVKFTTQITYARPADCEQVSANPLVIFPNPTQGWTTILLSEPAQNVSVRLFSVNGQLEKSYTFSNGINPIRLDLSEFSSGIHTVQVSNGTSTASSHIIKQ